MGYYSKVVFAMKTEDVPVLVAGQRRPLEKLAGGNTEKKRLLEDGYRLLYLEAGKYPASDDVGFRCQTGADGRACAFGWNEVKWHEDDEGYEDVTALMRTWRDLGFGTRERPGQYCRVGEDWDGVDYDNGRPAGDSCAIWPQADIAVHI